MAVSLLDPGLRVPRHRATTAHLCAAYPFQAEPGFGCRGVYMGQLAGGAAFYFEPFQAYTDLLVDNPNMLIVGLPRVGKSTTVKTFLARSMGAMRADDGGRRRWVAIVDPKGEYGGLADFLALDVLRLYPGGSTRLNPLDPGPTSATNLGPEVEEQSRVARTAMVAALVGSVLGRPLSAIEDAALGWAVGAVCASGRLGVPTLADVAALLGQPTPEMAQRAAKAPTALATAVDDARLALGKLLDRELRGMFDGASSLRIDGSGRGLVLDVSAVRHNHAALALVMIAATGWLQTALARPAENPALRRYQVVDEAWALLGDARTAAHLQASWKLCSAYGVANVAVTHRLSDLRSQADDGTTTAKVSAGLLADTATRVLLRQSADQIPEAVELLGLSPAEAFAVERLPDKGRALWQIKDHPVVVQNVIGPDEGAFCDTDQNLRD